MEGKSQGWLRLAADSEKRWRAAPQRKAASFVLGVWSGIWYGSLTRGTVAKLVGCAIVEEL